MSQNDQKFSVVAAQQNYLNQMVQCHVKAFPREFMSLIGNRFIKSFYRFFISHEDGIVLVALEPSGNVIGLVVGGKPELRSQFSRTRVPFHIWDIILAAITYGSARKRLAQHVLSAVKKVFVKLGVVRQDFDRNEPPVDPPGTWSGLLSICTDPDFRGRGIGKSLMEAFKAECLVRGYRIMRLSVHSDNHPAITLYKKCGWQVVLETKQGIYFKRSVNG